MSECVHVQALVPTQTQKGKKSDPRKPLLVQGWVWMPSWYLSLVYWRHPSQAATSQHSTTAPDARRAKSILPALPANPTGEREHLCEERESLTGKSVEEQWGSE